MTARPRPPDGAEKTPPRTPTGSHPVTKMIDGLAAGSLSLADAALWCASHDWPDPTNPPINSAAAAAKAAMTDHHPPPLGSFIEVTRAWHADRITTEQYTALLYAAAGKPAAAPTESPAAPPGDATLTPPAS